MTVALRRAAMTEAEFLRLPVSMNKVELLDGEVVVAPSPTYRHQAILTRIVIALQAWAEKQKRAVTVCQSPLDVRFGPGRILQPDAFLLFGRVPLAHQGPIDRIPALCVEILSEDRVYDRVTKRLLYAAAGVKELWVVDTAGAVERWTGKGLTGNEVVKRRLSTPLLPGFTLDLQQLFATSRGWHPKRQA
jgi:Uma2 family endonuclease